MPECSQPLVTAASSPEAIARHKASLPVRLWEVSAQRKLIPHDLQMLLGMPVNIVRMSDHAWTNVQEPSLGKPTNAAGDALKEKRGQHFSARRFVESLDVWLEHRQWIGKAPPNKGRASEIAWEVYTAVTPRAWLVCIIAQRPDSEFVIKTTYLTSNERFEPRSVLTEIAVALTSSRICISFPGRYDRRTGKVYIWHIVIPQEGH